MKIGIISDIHSNIYGLQSVLKELKGADSILCAGDIVGYHPFVNEIFEEIKRINIKPVLGNHDAYLLGLKPVPNSPIIKHAIQYTKKIITRDNLEYLKNIKSPSADLEIDGLRIKIFHGSPWDNFEEYIYPDYKQFGKFCRIDADLVILGHTHWPMLKRIGDVIILNPGSCGQPRDNQRASFALFDTKTKKVSIKRIRYNIGKLCEEMENKGFPQELIQLLKMKK